MHRIVALSLASLACFGAHAADPAPLLSFAGGTAATLVHDADGDDTARLVGEMRKGLKDAPRVVLAAVDYKDGRGDGLAKAFLPELKVIQGSLVALSVRVKHADAPAVLPGAYVLTLAVEGGPSRASSQQQLVTVTLTRQAPALATPPKVVISVLRPVFGDDFDQVAGELKIEETGRKAGLSKLAVDETHVATTMELDTGRLVFGPWAGLPLEPMSAASAPVTTNQQFPLGTTSGNITLRAGELAAPVVVAYEVRVRRGLKWLAIVACLGSLAGWVLRVALPAVQGRTSARVEARELRQTLLRQFNSASDDDLRRALSEAIQVIDDGLAQTDPKRIAAAAEQARASAAAATARLQQSMDGVRQALDAPYQSLAPDWTLPPSLQPLFDRARSHLDAARRGLDLHDALAAARAERELREIDLPALDRALVRFVDSLASYLARFVALRPPLRSADLAAVNDFAQRVAATRAQAAPAEETTSARLARASEFQDDFRALALQLPELADAFVDDALAASGLLPGEAQYGVPDVRAASRQLAEQFGGDEGGIDGAIFRLSGLVQRARGAWLRWLCELVPSADPALIRQALETGQWMAAIAVALPAPAVARLQSRQIGAEPAAAPAALVLNARSRLVARALPAATTPPISIPQPDAEALTADRTLLSVVGITQTACVAALFVTVTTLTMADTWVGNPNQLVTVFLLAFGVDLSSDGLIAAFKNKSAAG